MPKYMVPVYFTIRYEAFVEAENEEQAVVRARYMELEEMADDREYCDTEYYPATLVEESE